MSCSRLLSQVWPSVLSFTRDILDFGLLTRKTRKPRNRTGQPGILRGFNRYQIDYQANQEKIKYFHLNTNTHLNKHLNTHLNTLKRTLEH